MQRRPEQEAHRHQGRRLQRRRLPGQPSALENCLTAADDNCNGSNNDVGASACTNYYVDGDGDGFGDKQAQAVCLCSPDATKKLTAKDNSDCNDNNSAVKPGVKDSCNTAGIDDNCDGNTDSDDSLNCTTYYFDGDSDGVGSGAERCMCNADVAKKYTAKKTGDCNDSDNTIKPGATELCNGVDDDCAGGVDNGASVSCPKVSSATSVCSGAKCGIGNCTTNYFDIDKNFNNGCECKADDHYGKKGNTCGNYIDLGDIADNNTAKSDAGNLMPGEAGQWYRFRAVDGADTSTTNSCDNFHVKVEFTNNPSGTYQFDVFRTTSSSTTGCGSSSTRICQNETVHEWKTDFYSSSAASGPGALTNGTGTYGRVKPSPSTKPSGECKCTTTSNVTKYPVDGKTYTGYSLPGMNRCVNNTAYYYVYVHYAAGKNATCSGYTLKVQNGF
ncbi:MAG: putative metal-binding motif-containing protein [Deltaproteobacteria bacterium]|nr:putative metal-binding motif-containing protein [Deltaproteobacteria bacterium]